MKRGSATMAIVSTRLRKEMRAGIFAVCLGGLLAYVQRFDDAPAHLAGVLIFGTLVGIGTALAQRGAGRLRELELCEQSAPLYGRELARATAIVPCAIATVSVIAYWIVEALFAPFDAYGIALSLLGTSAATLVALSATLRSGWLRLAYVSLAGAVAAIAFVAGNGVTWPGAAACALAGFIALRGYGEALARYDPIA